MSEFIAEARVLVTPDTTKFRAELQAELAAATRGVTVPVTVVPTASTTGLTALTAETQAASTATRALAQEQVAGAEVSRRAGAQAAAHAKQLGQVEKAAFASAASMVGLRGAVLTAGSAFLGATVGITAFAKAVQSAAELEQQLNVFRVTAGATADEMERVSAQAQALGRDLTLPGVTASDAATAMTELAKAGLSVENSLDGARGVLQLATAAQLDNASASELVANALNSFSLAGDDAVRVADLLTGASNEAQGSIADMGLALKQSAAVANLAGLSIEDTVVILTELAQAGLSASDAGTSFRTALTRLIGDFPKVQTELQKLGVQLRDSSGAIRPEVFNEIGVALQKLTPAARQQAVAILGGSDAIRAFGILSQRTAAQTAALTEAVTEQGLAQELAGARTQGFSGDVENLNNQMSALGLAIGQLAIPPLSLFVKSLADTASALNDTITATRNLITEVAGLGKPFADAIPFLDRAEGSLGKIVGTAAKFQLLGPAITIASLALDRFGKSAEDAGSKSTVFDQVVDSITESINNLSNSLKNFHGAARPTDAGLNVQQVLNRVTGFDSAEVRARIHGSTEELLGVLTDEQDFLESQLQRDFVQRRPALQRQLEQALLGVTNDISSISQKAATDTKAAAAEASRALKDADTALLDALSQRRDDAQRKISTAGDTEGVRDDIRRQNEFQALIKIQIIKIRAQVKDQQARKDAIRELRIALIASRQEEAKLRQERAQEAAAAQQENINLDITFAQTTNNVSREVAARQRLIALLRKQQSHVKKGTIEWKRLRNDIAEQQAAIREARKQQEEGKKEGKTFAQSAFEFLQTQQGFASNLLGNLIPGFATAGLVGGSSSTPTAGPSPQDVGAGVRQGAALQAAETRGVRPVQVDQTNAILRQILAAVQGRGRPAPETVHNRRVGSAMMDTLGGIHGA